MVVVVVVVLVAVEPVVVVVVVALYVSDYHSQYVYEMYVSRVAL